MDKTYKDSRILCTENMEAHKFLCNIGAHTVTIVHASDEINKDIWATIHN